MAEVIQNPILNSPYREPTRHFHFDDDGITSTIVEGRRSSAPQGVLAVSADPRPPSPEPA